MDIQLFCYFVILLLWHPNFTSGMDKVYLDLYTFSPVLPPVCVRECKLKNIKPWGWVGGGGDDTISAKHQLIAITVCSDSISFQVMAFPTMSITSHPFKPIKNEKEAAVVAMRACGAITVVWCECPVRSRHPYLICARGIQQMTFQAFFVSFTAD